MALLAVAFGFAVAGAIVGPTSATASRSVIAVEPASSWDAAPLARQTPAPSPTPAGERTGSGMVDSALAWLRQRSGAMLSAARDGSPSEVVPAIQPDVAARLEAQVMHEGPPASAPTGTPRPIAATTADATAALYGASMVQTSPTATPTPTPIATP